MTDTIQKTDLTHLTHPKIAAVLGQSAWASLDLQSRIGEAHAVFESAYKQENDELAAALVPYLNGALRAYHIDGMPSPNPMGVFRCLTFAYADVGYGLVPRGNHMRATRLSLFQAILGLWSGKDHGKTSVAAFEWCSAVANPSLDFTAQQSKSFIRESLRWLAGDERQSMLDRMKNRFNDSSFLSEDSINWWLDKYASIKGFSELVIKMLAVAQVEKGGVDFVRSRAHNRRACMYLDPLHRSSAALILHDELCRKVVEFDEFVKGNLIELMGGGTEGMDADVVGTAIRMYGKITWTCPSLFDHVRVNIVLSEEMSVDLRRDMKRRAHVHAQRFYEILELKVGVSIWMFVPGQNEVACRVRRGAFITGDGPIDADARELD